jgi:acetyltransferase-like isoleucine patch superfamily enzyme
MNSMVRAYRNFVHGRKFAKKGKGCQFPGQFLEVDGHVELGDYCRFRNNVILRTHRGGKIIFGNRSGCSYYVIIEAAELVKIGDFTAITEFVVIRDANHLVYGTEKHWRWAPLITRPVIIGNGCLIGSRSYISPGVTIGDGAIIKPGSIVTKDVGPFEVWAGVPARFVAHRTKSVPPERLKEAEALIAQHGIGDDRYMSANAWMDADE